MHNSIHSLSPPVSVALSYSSLHALFGQGSTTMFRCGPEHVCSVSIPWCINILSHTHQPLPALTFALTTFTLILLDPFLLSQDTSICLPALTASPVGLKPSLSQISLSWYPFSHLHRQRTQFESELWTHLMQLFSVKCIRMTAYYPIANGLV